MKTPLALHPNVLCVVLACVGFALSGGSEAPRVSEVDLSNLLIVVEYDRENEQLRSGEVLDFRLERDRNAYWERTARDPDWDQSHRFLARSRSSISIGPGSARVLILEDFFGYGGIGSYLSVWSAMDDSLRFQCICPERFSFGLSVAEVLAVVEAPDAIYVLSETRGGDAGDQWGSLQVHFVQSCSAALYFSESWKADYICLSGDPVFEYKYVPEASSDSLIVVLKESQVCREDSLEPGEQREIRISLSGTSVAP